MNKTIFRKALLESLIDPKAPGKMAVILDAKNPTYFIQRAIEELRIGKNGNMTLAITLITAAKVFESQTAPPIKKPKSRVPYYVKKAIDCGHTVDDFDYRGDIAKWDALHRDRRTNTQRVSIEPDMWAEFADVLLRKTPLKQLVDKAFNLGYKVDAFRDRGGLFIAKHPDKRSVSVDLARVTEFKQKLQTQWDAVPSHLAVALAKEAVAKGRKFEDFVHQGTYWRANDDGLKPLIVADENWQRFREEVIKLENTENNQ